MLPVNDTLEHHQLKIFTLENNQLRIKVMNLGATWLSCEVKTPQGWQEILLGCQPEEYIHQSCYFGATIGRYANRIANSQFYLNNQLYRLSSNQGKHQLHGGKGFSYVYWKVEKCQPNMLCFSYFSVNGDDGFPGNLQLTVRYILEDKQVRILFEGCCDQDCPLNFTNHAYFNLAEAVQGCDVRGHSLQLFADQFLPVNNEGIPNHTLKAVEGTSFDFRQGKKIQQDFGQEEQQATKGYDHSFMLNPEAETALILTSPSGHLQLTMQTSYPAMQIYTGNYLAGNATRNGGNYSDFAGIALEPQFLPDTPNHPEWWQFGGITQANTPYREEIIYHIESREI